MTQQELQDYKNRKVLSKDKFRNHGLDSMSDFEVIELILMFRLNKIDAGVVTASLFDKFGSFTGILEASIDALSEVEGMNEQACCLIHMMMPLHGVYHNSIEEKMRKTLKLEDSEAYFKYLQPKFLDAANERVIVIFLQNDLTLIESQIMGEGVIDGVELNKNKILMHALKLDCEKIIISHNHPHGMAKPSIEDDILTFEMIKTLKPMGVEVLDHVILSDNEYFSYRDSGML